jgi:hypothetical protein
MISSSSSLYPASTSSESFPESSLQSPTKKDADASSFAPRIVNSSDFDVDDVSYRLRLLVNNNYFLPPAHHKPSPLSLTSQNPPQAQKVPKPATPGFFDFFRIGKSKSKSTTPVCRSPTAVEHPPPLLRTTSDSTTAGGYVQRSPAASEARVTAGLPFAAAAANSSQSRVVVLRERMDDLMAAAKQAERDIKSRGEGRKARSVTSPNTTFDDVVDPTDAVDLPPLPAGHPFAAQISALYGLGPGESVGADLLANQLPPSPGVWSMSSEEESWRKAILQEAVSLSLSESPEQSFSSMSPSSPESPSPRFFRAQDEEKVEECASPSTPKPAPPLIGQRILEPLELSSATQDGTTLSPLSGVQSLSSAQPTSSATQLALGTLSLPWRTSLNPPRAETPAATQPLTPPPPRKPFSPLHHSFSTDDLYRSAGMEPERSQQRSFLHALRRVVSSPRLSAVPDQQLEPITFVGSPEFIGRHLSSVSPSPDLAVRDTIALSSRPSTTSLLRASPLFSDDDSLVYATPMDYTEDEPPSRPSMTLSIPTIGRPSMSDYPNPSPTASAFHDAVLQDAVFGSYRASSPMHVRRSHAGSITVGSPVRPAIPRRTTATPPPRESSTFGTVLPPPPRSPAIKPIFRPSTVSSNTLAHTTSSHASSPLSSSFEVESNLPLSSNPSIDHSLTERRGLPTLQSLQIPSELITPAIHSAPAPASPTAFFDRIQSHPNAMDDLETSDESDNEEEATLPVPPPVMPSTMPPPSPKTTASSDSSVKSGLSRPSQSSARPSIMRLGNHSSPHLGSNSGQEMEFPAFDGLDPKKPIGNIPEKGTFFTARSRKKSGKGQATFPLPVESSSVVRTVGTRPARSQSTTSSKADKKERAWQRESLQRFDGMLLEHMAAERATIKRITSNISSTRH